MLLLTLPFYQK